MTTKTGRDRPDRPETEGSPADELAAARAEFAALEHELRFENPEAERQAQDARRGAVGNPASGPDADERLLAVRRRHNEIVINLLPLARARVAVAEAERRRTPDAALAADAAALADAERAVSALERERAEMPQRIQAAAEAADPAFIALRHRLDEIPIELMAARVRLLRLRIAAVETSEAEARAEHPALEKDLAQKRAALEHAQAAYGAAQRAAALVLASARDSHGEARQLRYELADLLAEQGRDKGPIVRSLIHAGRGAGDG